MFSAVFWARILVLAQAALIVRRHLKRLETDERRRLASLVAKSKGRPGSKLTVNEREEMLRLVRKLDLTTLGRDAAGVARRGLTLRK